MVPLVRRGYLLALLVLLSGCDTTTAEEHTARAVEQLADGGYRTAVIELKNALQKNPEHAEARALLGEAHYGLGDFASAHKEFERALDLGLDDDRVRAGLLRSKVRLGSYQEVIGALEDEGALEPEFAVILGDAYLGAGDVPRAKALFEQGRALSDGSLGLGLIAWQEGRVEQAGEHLAEAVRLDPDNWQAWLRKGELELSRGEIDAADAAFRQAAAAPASRVLGHVGLARVDLTQGNLDAAATEVKEVLRLAPDFVVGHYLDGLIRFQQQDLEGAEGAIREVQRTAPDHPPSLYLMGAIKYGQQQFAQAEHNLQRYLAQDPGNSSAAKLLASARFDQGNFQGAVDAIEPFVDGSDDPQLLAMHGAAQLRLGRPAQAARSLERSVELAPDMAPFRNQLALSLLAAGDRTGAEAQLQGALEVDGDQFQSDYLLAMVRLREGEWDAASEAVEALIQKNPDSPFGYNLRGAVAMGRQDAEAAGAAFREALERDPEFFPALQNLARLREQSGDREGAMALYRDFVAAHPDNEGAYLALAELALRQNDLAGALEHLEASLANNSGAARSSLALARLHLASGRVEDAGRVLDAALAQAPGLTDLLLLRAEVHLRSGNTAAAGQVATQLQSQAAGGTDDPALLLALGRLQARLGDAGPARRNLERVLQATDGSVPAALQTLVRLDLAERNMERARERLARLSELAPEHPETRLLTGDLALAENRSSDAQQVYESLAEDGHREGVMRLATINLAQGEAGAALKRLDGWLERYPQDLGAQLLSADALMREDQNAARARYETLMDTGNPVVLNNLAWLYLQNDDPRAEETARRAVAAAPENADILDTLGWILLKQKGDASEAVRTLRRSVQLNPDNPSVQYHLGMALKDAGDATGARQALNRALQNSGFPEESEARAALAGL